VDVRLKKREEAVEVISLVVASDSPMYSNEWEFTVKGE
jgi:hypothetical protein